jgi:hypothetical protein
MSSNSSVEFQPLTSEGQLNRDWLSVESWELDQYLGPMKQSSYK